MQPKLVYRDDHGATAGSLRLIPEIPIPYLTLCATDATFSIVPQHLSLVCNSALESQLRWIVRRRRKERKKEEEEEQQQQEQQQQEQQKQQEQGQEEENKYK